MSSSRRLCLHNLLLRLVVRELCSSGINPLAQQLICLPELIRVSISTVWSINCMTDQFGWSDTNCRSLHI